MTPKIIYWDSCAFIHRFMETSEHIDALREQIQRAQSGQCKIATSAVTLAEVCKLPDSGMLPLEQTKKILAFFENEYLIVYQADRLVCEEAHHIIRFHGLLPMDAIHVATAITAKAELFVTTDSKKFRRNGLLQHNERIGNPPLKISVPDLGTFLPLFANEIRSKDQETGTK